MVKPCQLNHISKREGYLSVSSSTLNCVRIQAKGNSERSKELSHGHVILNCVGNNEVELGRQDGRGGSQRNHQKTIRSLRRDEGKYEIIIAITSSHLPFQLHGRMGCFSNLNTHLLFVNLNADLQI